MEIPIAQQISEVVYELKMREDVYARRVRDGKMTQKVADYRIERMQAVLATLKWLQVNVARIKARLREEAT